MDEKTFDVSPLIKDYMDKLGVLCLFCMHPITKEELTKSPSNFQLLPQTLKVSLGNVTIKKYNKVFAVCGKCFTHSDMRMKMLKEPFDIKINLEEIQSEVAKQIQLNELRKAHQAQLNDLVKGKDDVAKG